MLYLSFQEKQEHEVFDPDGFLKFRQDEAVEWFNDDFVKRMVRSVDRSEVISAYSIASPYIGIINYNELSSGVKNLVIAYKTDRPIQSRWMGKNCINWLMRIAEEKDVYLTINHALEFESYGNFKAKVLNENADIKEINSLADYLHCVVTLL